MLLKVLYFNVAPLVLIYRTDNVMSWNISLSPTGPISTWQNEDVNLTCDGPPSINATKFNLNQRAIRNNDNRFEMKEINKNVSVLTMYSAYMETCVNIRLTCNKIYDSRIYASNKVQVEVKPLIQTVHLSQTERIGSGMTENTTVNFTCSTLCNCTTPAFIWNVRDRDNIKFNQTECLRSTNLTTSRLTYIVNRLDNGSYVNCAASNENGHTVYSSNITLIVVYPPGNMAMSGGSGSEYSVIEHTRGTLNCSVNGGNPLPTLSWNCSFANVVTLKSTLIVQSTITWNASRDNSKTCACISNHPLYNQPEVATKTINVLYPPLLATMPNVNVIENSSLTVVSYVKDSNPDVSEVHWKKADSNKVLSNSFTLSVPKVTKNSKGSYICSAQNILVPSDGNTMNGTDRKQFYLDVLYPPHVHGLNNVSIWEGESLNISCNVSEGNPSHTSIQWTRSQDSKMWTTKRLNITSVKRTDSSVYTCTSWNVMHPTNRSTQNGTHSRIFTLNVKYKTTIKLFNINTSDGRYNHTLPENTNFSLVCQADGNPLPNMTIKHINDTLTYKILSDTVSVYKSASCTDFGEYTCQASNRNNHISTDSINIYILCSPRQNPKVAIVLIAASALHQNITFSYSALAYPHPTFIWYRHGSSIDINDQRTIISSSNLQTNLTITRIEENDFGKYILNVTNEVGSITEEFHLNPQGVPEAPTTFTKDNTSTTDTTIALYWVPGFNNGLEQTFTLLYKKLHDDHWQSANVPDTGTKTIRYNITGLSSDTNYTIVLFSSNDMGRSKSNVTLNCATELTVQALRIPVTLNIGVIVGGIIGGVVVVTCVILFSVFFCRRRKQNKQQDAIRKETSSTALYANVQNDDHRLVESNVNRVEDRGIYENADLGKSQKSRHKLYNDTPNEEQKLADNGKTGDFLPLKPNDVKAPKQAPNSSNIPPPVPMKTDFSKILSKVDDDDSHVISDVVNGDENIYNNSTEKIEHIENVYVQELFDFVAGKSFQSFAAEFLILPKGLTMPCTVAVKPENIKLNRYNGIFPYDHSRVIIPDDPDFFMNACYVDGFKNEKGYIASLGPTADTSGGFKTFWKMVWHEQSDIIVMLTNLREISGMKCEQYWPKLGPGKVYGEVTVTCINVEIFAEYTVRTFNVSNGGHVRSLTQLHFTAWPDKGVPEDLTSLLEFRQRMRCTPSLERGRIVVHCSAGIGRTGTLIALDLLIAEGKTTNSINVSTCIRNMRQQRVNMVQTPEQYVYIYKACVYALAYESESIPADTFRDNLKKTTDAMFSDVFNKLKPMVDNESDKEKVAIKSNGQEKSNRPKAEVAGDKYRVRLYIDKNSEESDYINAVYINSFKTKNKFIAAQSPMKNFVQDFICMIYQEQCICVVDMDEKVSTKMDVGTYMPPANQALTFGGFKITTTRLDDNPKYTVNKVKIENTGKVYKGEWTTYHFKYHDWKHNKETPGEPGDFVEFLKEVEEYATQFGEQESQVLVHCMDGSAKSGLFCFVACLLEKVECERQVNIGNTLRQVRTRRKTVIKSPNQLKFCYKTVDAFIDMNKSK